MNKIKLALILRKYKKCEKNIVKLSKNDFNRMQYNMRKKLNLVLVGNLFLNNDYIILPSKGIADLKRRILYEPII